MFFVRRADLSLDPEQSEKLRNQSLMQPSLVRLFMVSGRHDMSFVAQVADNRCSFLDRGKIIESGDTR